MSASTGRTPWLDDHSYEYASLEECAALCDGEATCTAFSDSRVLGPILYGSKYCTFWRGSVDKTSFFGVDTYLQTGGGGGGGDACSPSSGWPKFTSESQLALDAWGIYFRTVYGELPKFTYPFCVGDLFMFYDKHITISGATAPAIKGNCPGSSSPEGSRYAQNNMYQPSDTSFSWHRPPYAAVPTSTWAEVGHMADPFGDEHYGMWLLLATGSGVWFNTGATIVFEEHSQSFDHFGTHTGDVNEEMCKAAVGHGYDSVQFTRHVDHVNYPCDHNAGVAYMNLEIVAVRLTGTYACGASGGAPSAIRGGWQGSRTCNCDNSKQTLNCGVFSSSVEGAAVV